MSVWWKYRGKDVQANRCQRCGRRIVERVVRTRWRHYGERRWLHATPRAVGHTPQLPSEAWRHTPEFCLEEELRRTTDNAQAIDRLARHEPTGTVWRPNVIRVTNIKRDPATADKRLTLIHVQRQLGTAIDRVVAGEMSPQQAHAVAGNARQIISSVRLAIEYAKLTGTMPAVELLDGSYESAAA